MTCPFLFSMKPVSENDELVNQSRDHHFLMQSAANSGECELRDFFNDDNKRVANVGCLRVEMLLDFHFDCFEDFEHIGCAIFHAAVALSNFNELPTVKSAGKRDLWVFKDKRHSLQLPVNLKIRLLRAYIR